MGYTRTKGHGVSFWKMDERGRAPLLFVALEINRKIEGHRPSIYFSPAFYK
jgi:hypothetical protein